MSVTRQEVLALIKAPPPGYLLLDVRRAIETADGVIDGAKCIPVDDVATSLGMTPEAHLEAFGFPKPNLTDLVVVYCHAGGRAARACSSFQEAGYTNCKVYPGSWGEWSSS